MSWHIKTMEIHAGTYQDIKNLIASRERRISVERQLRLETHKGWDIFSLDDNNVGIVLNATPYPTRNAAIEKAREIFGADCMKMIRR